MKCPKCDYLGFEEVDRCRNCGYDFSLMSAPEIPELPLRSDHADLGPLDDLTLVDAAAQLLPSESARSTAVAEQPADRSRGLQRQNCRCSGRHKNWRPLRMIRP